MTKNNIIKLIDKKYLDKFNKTIPDFSYGDSIKVHIKIQEGKRSRIQIFEGVVIAIKNDGLNSAFTVRKVSNAIGVEKRFPKYSPIIDKIELVKFGKVRRAKLYYLRNLSGKSARIPEDINKKRKYNSK